MKSNFYIVDTQVELGDALSKEIQNQSIVYEIMHMEKVVASISKHGIAKIFNEQFMPYDLYLEDISNPSIETRMNNLNNFNHWCASRVLSIDRKFAKEILNSIGVSQATTDQDRANISLSYHCVSLIDVFWVKKQSDSISFREINLYDNPLNEAIVDLPLKGKQMTVTNQELAPDLSTKGCFPKAWIRDKNGFKLLKDGGDDVVQRELIASQICQCFDFPQVKYTQRIYDNQIVTESEIITSKKLSMISKFSFDIYAVNHDLNTIEECIKLDPVAYYGMNILDYLIGNTDRHPENWGFLVDNETNKPVSLYPLMDFNQSFLSYDEIDGAPCQTTPTAVKQKTAAIEAVKIVGLRQIKEIDSSIFENLKNKSDMFFKRLSILQNYNIQN